MKYLDKRNYCVGTEPVHWYNIGILVISTSTSHGGSVVSVLVSQAKGRCLFPSCVISFFSHKYFSFFPFPTSVRPNGQSINLVGFFVIDTPT